MHRLAQGVSILFHPIFASFYGLAAIVHWHFVVGAKLGGQREVFFLAIFFLSLVVIPLVGIILLLRKYRITDLAILTEEERRVSILVMAVLYTFMLLSFDSLFLVPIIKVYLGSLTLIAGLGYALSRFVRVSFHMLAWGGLTAFFVLLSRHSTQNMDVFILSVVLLSGLIGSSRLIVKAHKQSELYLGYSAGLIANTLLYLIIYGFQ